MYGGPAFIIGRSPPEQAAITLCRLKWMGLPELNITGRLNVVMGVQQNPPRSGWASHNAVYRGMAAVHAQQFDVIEARMLQPISCRNG